MKEIHKTLVFVAVAALVVVIGMLARPAPPVSNTKDLLGQRLFPDFNDPLAAASMEILRFDKDTAEVRPFTVAQVDVKGEGKPRWAIPTHENYPADARDQVADAASGVIGLTIIDVASTDPGDHQEYGVVDPDPKKRKGNAGVGTRVTMRDNRGKVLMSLIVGNEVPDQSGLRYVRKADEDPVYVAKVSTDKLSAEFKDWIEKDLLKLNTWDARQVRIRDHSVDEFNMALIQRGDMTLKYDDTATPMWTLLKDEEFRDRQWVPVPMAPDEELDTDKLDDMLDALDTLEIVDVARKPPGLSADLKAEEEFLNSDETLDSLTSCGFFPAKVGDRIELVSNEGEIRCLMKDGVEYVLRFGEIAGVGAASQDEQESGEKGSASPGLNRYIFVMVEFNPSIIRKPELEPLPEEEQQPQQEPAAPEAVQEQTPEEEAPADQPPAEDAADQPNEDPEEDPEANADQAEAGDKSDTESARQRIEKENKRKQDKYDEEVQNGKKRVTELNQRFADWYYVISDSVYQKIHLGRDQIVKKKQAEQTPATEEGTEPSGPLGEFDVLKQEGLEGAGGAGASDATMPPLPPAPSP